MDDFERQLSELKPSPLSEPALVRIGERIAHKERSSQRARWFAAIGGLTAVLAASAMGWRYMAEPGIEPELSPAPVFSVATPEENPAAFEPVDRYYTILDAREGPVYFYKEGVPARNIYIKYLDTTVLQDKQTHAVLRIESPKEETRVVPVVLY